MIVELHSPLLPENKNSLHPEAILMPPNAARPVEQKENRILLEVIIVALVRLTGHTNRARARCSRRNALHVVKTPKYLLNPLRVDQYTVQIVTAKRTPLKDKRPKVQC